MHSRANLKPPMHTSIRHKHKCKCIHCACTKWICKHKCEKTHKNVHFPHQTQLPLAYLASSKVVLLVQTWLLFKCHEERATCFKRAGSRPVLDDCAREGLCPRSHPETRLCVWGGWAGTQPVIPALWSSLTKREAGTAQPARTHTCTYTHTYTHKGTDRYTQTERCKGSTPEHAPALDPLALAPDPLGKGSALS